MIINSRKSFIYVAKQKVTKQQMYQLDKKMTRKWITKNKTSPLYHLFLSLLITSRLFYQKKNSLLPPAKTDWPLPLNSSLSLFIKLPKQTPPQAVSSLFFRLLFLSLPQE